MSLKRVIGKLQNNSRTSSVQRGFQFDQPQMIGTSSVQRGYSVEQPHIIGSSSVFRQPSVQQQPIQQASVIDLEQTSGLKRKYKEMKKLLKESQEKEQRLKAIVDSKAKDHKELKEQAEQLSTMIVTLQKMQSDQDERIAKQRELIAANQNLDVKMKFPMKTTIQDIEVCPTFGKMPQK